MSLSFWVPVRSESDSRVSIRDISVLVDVDTMDGVFHQASNLPDDANEVSFSLLKVDGSFTLRAVARPFQRASKLCDITILRSLVVGVLCKSNDAKPNPGTSVRLNEEGEPQWATLLSKKHARHHKDP